MKKISLALSVLFVLFYSNCFAGWAPVNGYSGGSLNGESAPTETVVMIFTATVTNTIDPLPLDDYGGCVTGISLDMQSPAPDSVSVTLKNKLGLTIPSINAKTLTSDGFVKEPDDGKLICFSKGIPFTFTGTLDVGDQFIIAVDIMSAGK